MFAMSTACGSCNLHPGAHANHQKSHCYCASTNQHLILWAFLGYHFAWVNCNVVVIMVMSVVAMSIMGYMLMFMIVIAIAVVLMRLRHGLHS
jgi:hypothetical protein